MPAGITKKDSMFSVREVPWHGLGVVLDDYPKSVDEALEKAGLGWSVKSDAIALMRKLNANAKAARPLDEAQQELLRDIGVPLETKPNGDVVSSVRFVPTPGFRANVREDTDEVLGVVTDEYSLVDNREAFMFMDDLINSDMHFETAGSLWGGKRVWVLARLPEFVDVGGDSVATYAYVANAHDGGMALTAAVTPTRIVCQNTLNFALSEARRKFTFRHTGDLSKKFEEARRVLQITVDYEKQFKVFGDKLAKEKISEQRFQTKVLDELFKVEEGMGDRAAKNREEAKAAVMAIFKGEGQGGDTRGNAPGTKWCALNAVLEYRDHYRLMTKRSNQMQRSFEATKFKDRALPVVLAA